MRKRLAFAVSVLAVACADSNGDPTENVGTAEQEVRGVHTTVGHGGGTPGTSRHVKLIGHDPLFGRGMNAALAMFGNYIYVGNRSDGSNSCGDLNATGEVVPVLPPTNPDGTCTHLNPGVLTVDVHDPAHPAVVGEFGNEFVSGDNVGQTARELRVLPQQQLLMVMYFRCSRVIHVCPRSNQAFRIRFFDLVADPVNPPLIATYSPPAVPHEMFLWVDPEDDDRALLWLSTPTASVDPNVPNLLIVDISRAREGVFTEVARGNWNQFFPGAEDPASYDFDLALHSMTPTADGTITYLAHLRGGLGIIDTSDVAAGNIPPGTVEDLSDNLLTPAPFPTWGTGPICPGHTALGCGESHSAVPVPGRPFAFTIDEVYGTFTVASFGWPWGWGRLWDVRDPEEPELIAEYKIKQNAPGFQGSPGDDPETEQFTSYSSHNPTLTRRLAIDSWHSGGLQVIDIADPHRPKQVGWFSPTPLESVALEDPALSRGPNKVVMWSFPIIKDGLIYVVDVRNGLYILKYTGHRSHEIRRVDFLEGNSNLGDALHLAGIGHHGLLVDEGDDLE